MKRITGLLLAMGIFISSCNMPAAGAPNPQIATFAALTVQAASNVTPLASPTAGNSGVNAATQAVSTPTYSQPMVNVGDVTNCRKGPGTNYERIAQIFPADPVEIIGFFPPNYWIVSTKFGDCWVSGEFTTPAGSFAAVPTVTAPPTPGGGAPEGVSLQKWDIFCNFQTGQADISIKWSDKDDETGYRIVRNGEVVAELPGNSTQFAETIALLSGQNVGYSVEAFNIIGTANSSVIVLSC